MKLIVKLYAPLTARLPMNGGKLLATAFAAYVDAFDDSTMDGSFTVQFPVMEDSVWFHK